MKNIISKITKPLLSLLVLGGLALNSYSQDNNKMVNSLVDGFNEQKGKLIYNGTQVQNQHIIYRENVPYITPSNKKDLCNVMLINKKNKFHFIVDSENKINIDKIDTSPLAHVEYMFKIDKKTEEVEFEKMVIGHPDSLDLNSSIYHAYRNLIHIYKAVTEGL